MNKYMARKTYSRNNEISFMGSLPQLTIRTMILPVRKRDVVHRRAAGDGWHASLRSPCPLTCPMIGQSYRCQITALSHSISVVRSQTFRRFDQACRLPCGAVGTCAHEAPAVEIEKNERDIRNSKG